MAMPLELDHVFCIVDDLEDASRRLDREGWELDAGTAHGGQGTRNRRLAWPEHYLELLWVSDPVEARANRLRLDRRARWRETGASPFGFGLRGQVPGGYEDDYWHYDELGIPIWVHRDNEGTPERPLVFVLETPEDGLEQRKPRSRNPERFEGTGAGGLREVRVRGPAAPPLPPYDGPPVVPSSGPHGLELVLGEGPARQITELLALRGPPE